MNENIVKNESIFWLITFRNTTELVGTICLRNISEDETTDKIGFELLPENQGRHYVRGSAKNYSIRI